MTPALRAAREALAVKRRLAARHKTARSTLAFVLRVLRDELDYLDALDAADEAALLRERDLYTLPAHHRLP